MDTRLNNARDVLRGQGLTGAVLTNVSGQGVPRSISWSQGQWVAIGTNRTECYQECIYTSTKGHKCTVFVAGNPPSSFNTNGYKGKLHMGILNWEKENAIGFFFVIHPADWKPYQHRFKTDSLTGMVKDGVRAAAKAGGGAGGAAIGAVLGSVIPGAGTVVGAAVGGLAGYYTGVLGDAILGDYLHYLG